MSSSVPCRRLDATGYPEVLEGWGQAGSFRVAPGMPERPVRSKNWLGQTRTVLYPQTFVLIKVMIVWKGPGNGSNLRRRETPPVVRQGGCGPSP